MKPDNFSTPTRSFSPLLYCNINLLLGHVFPSEQQWMKTISQINFPKTSFSNCSGNWVIRLVRYSKLTRIAQDIVCECDCNWICYTFVLVDLPFQWKKGWEKIISCSQEIVLSHRRVRVDRHRCSLFNFGFLFTLFVLFVSNFNQILFNAIRKNYYRWWSNV